MKAAVRDRYGSPRVVRIEEIDRPTPTGDRILVRVRNASVNRADLDGILPRPQFVRLFMGLRAPRARQLGTDVAGVVEAVGPDVTRFKPGDRVFADSFLGGDGTFAEYFCAREKAFLPIPEALDFEVASTLPHSAILAVQGLRLRDGRTIGPGDKVLIDGASGNVGPFAVQVAKARGAVVTGVASTDKLDFVRSLGADHVIDYKTTDYTKTGEQYDWIVDTDSHHSLFAVRRALRPGGVYVTLGGNSLPIVAALLLGPILGRIWGKRMGLLIWWKPMKAEDMATIVELISAGNLAPRIDRHFPLAQVVDALNWVNDGLARGKVVIDV
ncbi:MAG TPA: NAD(P)-dependent alcohol dehydrogenase [Candidatus Limnocylindrales bacterium]|jgi:NADPH:quinone reductase-like Zn-dependent oxidoreductase